MKFIKFAILFLVTSVFFGALATSAIATEGESWWDEPMRFHVNVYGWLPEAPATIKVDGEEVAGLPESLDTILDSLDAAAMFELEAHKGPVGVFVNTVYYEGEDDTSFTGPLGQRRKLEVSEDKVFIVTYGLGYSLGTWQLAKDAAYPRVTVTPYVGGFYFHDDLTMKVKPGALDHGLNFKKNVEVHSPNVGLQTNWEFTDRFFVSLAGHYGGWDVDDVHRTRQFIGTGGYRFKMWDVSSKVFAGYRYLHLDLRKSDIEVHVDAKGPFVGLGWEF